MTSKCSIATTASRERSTTALTSCYQAPGSRRTGTRCSVRDRYTSTEHSAPSQAATGSSIQPTDQLRPFGSHQLGWSFAEEGGLDYEEARNNDGRRLGVPHPGSPV